MTNANYANSQKPCEVHQCKDCLEVFSNKKRVTKNWREDFDKEFDGNLYLGFKVKGEPEKAEKVRLKAFIQDLLDSQRRELIEEIRNKLPAARIKGAMGVPKYEVFGHNRAILKIEHILKDLVKKGKEKWGGK